MADHPTEIDGNIGKYKTFCLFPINDTLIFQSASAEISISHYDMLLQVVYQAANGKTILGLGNWQRTKNSEVQLTVILGMNLKVSLEFIKRIQNHLLLSEICVIRSLRSVRIRCYHK